ncbi:Pectinesterase [Quillaja saponaria]|uniref:Pectinesterase n=1 Tax=Quillaja saponaria TaxID=32244 RepID=A0AAD7VP28_QUISA|nr:Pectinesterase [Quillaja saponaria]
MVTKGRLFLTFILLCSIFFTALSKSSYSKNINWWCNKTPHPEPCKHYMKHRQHPHHHRSKLKHRAEFRKLMMEFAIDRVLISQRQAKEHVQNCQSNHQKAALKDCLKLYDNTVFQLNRTLHGLQTNRSCSNFDAQTWLSTALTNIETCRTGSLELNVSDFITPITGKNISELISNSLAINQGLLNIQDKENNYTEEYFPTWVSKHERRLLLSPSIKANLVVAKDGSGHFKTVQAALNLAGRRRGTGRFVIHVKKGVYRENIEVDKNNNNIMLVGDGIRNSIITSSRSVQGGSTTYNSATAGIDGLHFIARGITFSNIAGPLKGQAVALRSASDLSVFYGCAFQGYQDTLMVHSQRQFYKQCYIYGTIDFIFGNAAVVFQNCVICVRRPLKGQANVITAQARNDPFQNTGISIHNCQIRAAKDLIPVVRNFRTYLGRPWMQYSRTVIMQTYLDSLGEPIRMGSMAPN